MIPGVFAAAAAGSSSGAWSPANLVLPIWGTGDNPGNSVSSGAVVEIANLGAAIATATPNSSAAMVNQETLNGRPVLTADSLNHGYYTYDSGATGQWADRGEIYLFAVTSTRDPEPSVGTKELLTIARPAPTTGVLADLARNTETVNDFRAGGRRVSSATYAGASDATNHGGGWRIAIAVLQYSTRNIYLYVDGELVASGLLTSTAGNTANSPSANGPTIGATNSGGNLNANYHLAEWGIGNEHLTTTDRQRLEGYLAHEWGLAGSLPVGHPYRDTPP